MSVGFGLIGYGRFGKHHARAIANTKGAKLIAISARSEESCRSAAKKFNVATYTDYKNMLRHKDIDVVDIVVPNFLHKRIAIDALNNGKHVLLEKPMAINVRQCDTILRAVKRNKKLFHIGFEMRISPLWGRVKEMIDRGKIGKPILGIVELWRGPYRAGSGGWRYDRSKVGSWILEEPVHFIDLAYWYMQSIGKPVSVYARTNVRKKELKGFSENMSFVINFPQDVYVVINQTLAAYEHHQSVKIIGTQGALYARWDGTEDAAANPAFGLEYYDGKKVREVRIKELTGEIHEIGIEIKSMTDAVKKGKPTNLATGEDGKISVALCKASEKSAKINKVVPVR